MIVFPTSYVPTSLHGGCGGHGGLPTLTACSKLAPISITPASLMCEEGKVDEAHVHHVASVVEDSHVAVVLDLEELGDVVDEGEDHYGHDVKEAVEYLKINK